MAISFVAGQMLQSNLNRAGVDLAISNANVSIGTHVVISNTGNVNVGNVNINNLSNPVQNQDAATKYYVDHIGNIGNLTVSNTTISTSLATGNITLTPTGNALAYINTTTGLVIPTGTTAQRPATGNVAGTVRFNTDTTRIEVYDGTEWDQIVGGVTNQTFTGADGVTTVFTLNRKSTTAATLVMLNGIVQLPTTAYAVTDGGSGTFGNVLTFTQAPSTNDTIDVRFL